MNKTTLVCFCLLLLSVHVTGQDPVFINFSNASSYFNPAMTGIYTGLRTRFVYRDQHPSLPSEWRSYHLSSDLGDRNLPGSGGIGVVLNSDDEGLGCLHNYEAGVSVSARIPFTRYMAGQLGARASWLEKKVKSTDLNSIRALIERYGMHSDTIEVNEFQHLFLDAV